MTLEDGTPMESGDESTIEEVAPESVTAETPRDPEVPAAPDEPVAPDDPEVPVEPEDAALDDAIAQLGDPTPVTAQVSDEIIAAVEGSRHESVSTWPFGVYVGVWTAFSAFIVWRFIDVPATTALYELPLYRWVVIGGVALTIAGPVLALIVWLLAIRHPEAQRGALFASALVKGAIATFAGVCIWWASLLILDQIRIGSLL